MEYKKLEDRFRVAVKAFADKEGGDMTDLVEMLNEAIVFGRIEGLNDARLIVWGIGYDKDDTARLIRNRTYELMQRWSEPYELRDTLVRSAQQE